MYLSDSTVLLSLFYTYYVLYYCTPYMATAITANAATAVPWRGNTAVSPTRYCFVFIALHTYGAWPAPLGALTLHL